MVIFYPAGTVPARARAKEASRQEQLKPSMAISRAVNTSVTMSVGTAANTFDRDQFFLSVILTSVRTMVSRFGLVVIAAINLESAIRGLMLWPIMRPPGRIKGRSLSR